MDSNPATTYDDDVIDLRVYVNVLLRWWKEIFLFGLLLGILAGGALWLLGLLRTPMYAASADVAVVRTVSEVNLDERFTTTSEQPLANALVARRNALLALAESPALAQVVIDELGAQLNEDQRNPQFLVQRIDAELAAGNGRTADSDLIRITATTIDPDTSAQVATAWARAFVRSVNQTFGQVPDELFATLAQEQEASRINYESAQQAVEDFLVRSRVDELSRQVADKEFTINTLRRGRNQIITDLVNSTVEARASVAQTLSNAQAENLTDPFVAEQEGKRALLRAYLDTIFAGQTHVVSQRAQRDRDLLATYYTRWLQVSGALGEAEALRAQTEALGADAAGGSGSSALALALLKLQAFTSALDAPSSQALDVVTAPDVRIDSQATAEQPASTAPGLVQSSQPVQVQVGSTPLQIQLSDTTTLSNAEIITELDALVEALTVRRDELQGAIDALSATILGGSNVQYMDQTDPAAGEAALAMPALAETILNSNVLSGTLQAGAPVVTVDPQQLAALFNTDDLLALATIDQDADALGRTLAQLELELRDIKTQLEAERTTQLELIQARDLAQDAYRTANSKATELMLSRAGAGGELRFAAPAVAPAEALSGLSPLLLAIAAMLAGWVLATIYAFVADAMGRRPLLERSQTQQPAPTGA